MGVTDAERSGKGLQRSTTTMSSSKLSNVPRKLWRSRAKSQSRVSSFSACSWTPEGGCRWRGRTGGRLTLRPTTLLALSGVEASGLRPLALGKLQSLGIGCKVDIPKEDSTEVTKTRRRPALLRRKAITTSFFESRKENIPSAQVFGVPLPQVIQSDRLRFPADSAASDFADLGLVRGDDPTTETLSRRSDNASESSLSSLVDFSLEDDVLATHRLSHASSAFGSSSALDSMDRQRESSSDDDGLTVQGPQVPRVVRSCLRYLQDFGLTTVGIFRVSSSKRRVRQLREEFDSGREVHLEQERPQAHDVAQLLKEFFRDLPQPLLTRDLYVPFLYTQRTLERQKQLDMLRQLIRLLPSQNRDTLWALLRFLNRVAESSADRKTPQGELVSGNKMDAHNLATMLGPNILRYTSKSVKDKFIVENSERAEERSEVILVVRQLIENYDKLFEVSAEDMDSLYRRLLVERPEELDVLLRRRYYSAPGAHEDDSADQVFDDPNQDEDDDDDDDLQAVVLRAPVHRSRDRTPVHQDKGLPYILVTPEARSRTREVVSSDTKENDVSVSFTMKLPSASDVKTYLEENVDAADAERQAAKRSSKKATGDSQKKAKGTSRKLVSTKEKEEKSFKLNKSKSASSILNFFGASSDSRRDSSGSTDNSTRPSAASVQPEHQGRRNSRAPQSVRFQGEKWKRCDLISSEHTQKHHK
ncbi:rho GTPase-activating protein 6-like isoform X2 [Ornithodoros turicata]|uniref:rho GTPase-activating protein 6-like isoform X2 n=1 Tax=Ornithodoros turicata TaxID=34597 RepID=UPI003139C3B2